MAQPYVLAFVGENANGILAWWTRRILEGFARHGLAHRLIDLQGEWRPHLAECLMAGNPEFCFSFQGFGADLRLGGENYWSRNGIPFLTYLGDSPYHAPLLHAAEGEGIYLLYGCEDFFELYRDVMQGRAFATILRYGYPENPAAGRLAWRDRPHRLVFAKTGVDPLRLRLAWEALPGPIRSVLEEGAERALDGEDRTVAALCAEGFARRQIHWGERREQFLNVCSTLDRYLRAVRAERMVRQLMKQDAVIVGDWSHLDRSRARARFVAPVAAEALDGLYAEARIVVNTSPAVRRGVHERVMAGLLAQAAVLSDTTPFLSGMLGDCPAFIGLDIDGEAFPEAFAAVVADALGDPAMPEKVAASAAVARGLFSFDDFIQALLDHVALERHRRTVKAWSFPPRFLPAGVSVS